MNYSFVPIPGDLVDLVPGGGMWTLDGYTFVIKHAYGTPLLVIATIKAWQLFDPSGQQPKDLNTWVIVLADGNLYVVNVPHDSIR